MLMKTLLAGLSRLQFKKDWQLILFACILVLVTGALILHKDVEPKTGLAFLTGALALPGLFGRKNPEFVGEDSGDDDGDTPSSGSRLKAYVGEKSSGGNERRTLWLPAAVLVFLVAGCTPGQKQFARSALDVAQTACIIANATMSEEKVAEICAIEKAFYEPMRSLLASAKAAEAARPAGASHPYRPVVPPIVCSGDEASVRCSSSQ